MGLASRRWQSGEVDHSGRISRHGDAMLRSLLYECASCLLTRVRRAPRGGLSAGGGKGSPVDMWTSHSAPCPHVHRRNDKEEIFDLEGKRVLQFRASGESRPRRDGGLGDPVSWVASRSPHDRECAAHRGTPTSATPIMERAGQPTGEDSADNHVPGGTASNPTAEPNRRTRDEIDHPAGIRQPRGGASRWGRTCGTSPKPPAKSGYTASRKDCACRRAPLADPCRRRGTSTPTARPAMARRALR